MSEQALPGSGIARSLLIPLGVFLLLVVFLFLGFFLKDPHLLPSELINKPFPAFVLRDLKEPEIIRTRADLPAEISLVNVWGTWCPNCVLEHPELMRISEEEGIPVIGINYNDEDAKAIAWLARRGDPYQFSVVDDQGTLAIDLGVYGAPETFVVDPSGVIRYRHVGPITNEVWQDIMKPVLRQVEGAQVKGEQGG